MITVKCVRSVDFYITSLIAYFHYCNFGAALEVYFGLRSEGINESWMWMAAIAPSAAATIANWEFGVMSPAA